MYYIGGWKHDIIHFVYSWCYAVDTSGRFVAALHIADGALPFPFVIDRASDAAERVPTPTGHRVAIAGFVEGAP